MSNEKSNKSTNYYLQQRYLSGEMNTEKVSFEPDTGNRMYSDNSQENLGRKYNIEELDKCIKSNEEVVSIIDKIPLERTINLPPIEVNTIYLFCMKSLTKNETLSKLSKIEMFGLITDYINLNEKETKYFYKSLSIKFKAELLEELKDQKLYKSNRLF